MNKLERIALYALVAIGCVACGLVTAAARSVGIPVGSGADEAAAQVDAAIWSWVSYALGIGTTEGARVAVKVHRRRKAKKAAEPVVH